MGEMSHADVRNQVEQILLDLTNATHLVVNIDLRIEDAIREFSRSVPFFRQETLNVESRTGQASATTASALVDTNESQFVAADVGKVIFNDTDNTWAVVTAFVSTSQLTLSKDIFTVSEEYKMFNANCTKVNQLDISSLESTRIPYVVYPTQYMPERRRNVRITNNNKTLEFDLAWTPDDSKDTDSNVEAYVVMRTLHRLNTMTTLTGAINNGNITAGSTTLSVDALGDTEIIKRNTLFTIAGTRGIYRVTADVTTSGNAADLVIYPPLLDAIEDGDVLTFVSNTIPEELEDVIVNLTVGYLLQSQAFNKINEVNKGETSVGRDFFSIGRDVLRDARAVLRANLVRDIYEEYPNI